MERTDLGTEFEKISDKAKTATDKLKAANLRNKDQLETDVARARDKAAATADQFKHKADAAHIKRRRSGKRSGANGRPMSPR
jgi:hypothetical protein